MKRPTRAELVTAGSAALVSAALGAVVWFELIPAAAPPLAGTARQHGTAQHTVAREHEPGRQQRSSLPVQVVVFPHGSHTSPALTPSSSLTTGRPGTTPNPAPTSTASTSTRPSSPASSPPSHQSSPPPPTVLTTDPVCVIVLGVKTCLPIGVKK